MARREDRGRRACFGDSIKGTAGSLRSRAGMALGVV
jgi:hypothetical protein